MPYFVYILQSLKDGTYYVGVTQDLHERLERHNQGRSMFTKGKRPWEVVYWEDHETRGSAMKRERKIKSKKDKSYIGSLVRTSRRAR